MSQFVPWPDRHASDDQFVSLMEGVGVGRSRASELIESVNVVRFANF